MNNQEAFDITDELNKGLCIERLGNRHGSLRIREHEGRYQWTIEDCGVLWWGDIPKSLYDELLAYEATYAERLTKLNDESSKFFAEIADRIEGGRHE